MADEDFGNCKKSSSSRLVDRGRIRPFKSLGSPAWIHKSTPLSDVDVIYFDEKDLDENEMANETTTREELYQKKLTQLMPGPNWSVTNEARMHLFHGSKPYKNSEEALADWVETATCVGVKIDDAGKLTLTAPHGISDLAELILRPTMDTPENLKKFEDRVSQKHWLTKWPRLKVIK